MQVLNFVCLIFILGLPYSSFSACISQSDIDNEIDKIRSELKNIPAKKIRSELFRIAAIARLESKRKENGAEMERPSGEAAAARIDERKNNGKMKRSIKKSATARIDSRKEIKKMERRINKSVTALIDSRNKKIKEMGRPIESLHSDRVSIDFSSNQSENQRVESTGVAESVLFEPRAGHMVEMFFMWHIEYNYLPDKHPEEEYTKLELDNFNDTSHTCVNEHVTALLDALPNMNRQELTRTSQKLLDKLYTVGGRSLFQTIVNMNTFDETFRHIQAIGAPLSADEILVVEKMATILVDSPYCSHFGMGDWTEEHIFSG